MVPKWVPRLAFCSIGLLAVLALLLAVTARSLLLASLPRTSGTLNVSGIDAEIEVSRDSLGRVSIKGESLEDLAFSLGFVHAQERFFQMDLMRRNGAGRLSELLGAVMLQQDRKMRTFQFESVARSAIENLPKRHRDRIAAYAHGVNEGLHDLGARPPEYLVLRSQPEPWREIDCLLVAFSMHEMLSMGLHFERQMAVMSAALPPALVDLLTPETTRFDVFADGRTADDYEPERIPDTSEVNLRVRDQAVPPRAEAQVPNSDAELAAIGSNNWAVSAAKSGVGRAIVANDMHLSLGLPNIWFRVELNWPQHRAVGVSLPGFPTVVAGSTNHISWGFTNTSGDFEDLIIIEKDPLEPGRYQTPDGPKPYTRVTEQIRLRDGSVEPFTIMKTIWGPVVEEDLAGRELALKWSALDPEHFNANLLDMLEASSLEEALDIGRSWYGPSQNLVVAASDGRIGWIVTGWLPNRVGIDGSTPRSWADGTRRWEGPLDESLRPMLVNPESGFLVTANHRTMPDRYARLIGTHWSLPVRAARISERLNEQSQVDEHASFDIALDTRVRAIDMYKNLVLSLAESTIPRGEFNKELSCIAEWSGCADADSQAFAILALFRASVHQEILDPLTDPCRELDKRFRYSWFTSEETVQRILEERPAHLLPLPYESWDELFATAFVNVCAALREKNAEGPLPTWGARNRASIQHPFAASLPLLSPWLRMPADPLPGHSMAVRVQTPRFGASERMAVSPSALESGLLHTPGGQSGHPLSEHFGDGHAAWVSGTHEKAVRGDPVSTFKLIPR